MVESVYKNSKHTFYNMGISKTEDTKKYVTIPLMVNSEHGKAFIDSGCTFNAISEVFAKRCQLEIKDYPQDIQCEVGGGKIIMIKRRIAKVKFQLYNLGKFETSVFVMDNIPLGCEAIFGMDFLKIMNPKICWESGNVTMDTKKTHMEIENEIQYTKTMLHYTNHGHRSSKGETKVINSKSFKKEIRKMSQTKDSFCFIINPQEMTEKKQRYKDQNWEKLKDNPAFDVISKYKNTVFKEKLTSTRVEHKSDIQHRIDLKDKSPFSVKQFRLSPEQKQAVGDWVDEMMEAGLIRKSTSPFSSPIFCIKKPIGWRIIMDYRILNSRTKVPQEPIPRKEDIINSMHNSKWYSCMDLLSGYYQQLIHADDRAYTAFSTPSGHYEYIVMAQGLSGAPASFNRWVQTIFNDLNTFCKAYFDDIYCFTKSMDINVHLEALDKVLKRCEENGLLIKLSKCVFAATEIPVLGDFVGRKGVRMDPDKIAIIKHWPVPKTKKDLKSFLGTIAYCARFCSDYGRLVAPLQNALAGKGKNDLICLTDGQLDSFNRLVAAMTQAPVLALPDFAIPFGIRMDASDYAIGGVLFQRDETDKEHPIAYTGRKLNKAELNYTVREKELLAIIHALQKWRPYLLDKAFTVETDHKSLQELLTQRKCTQRLARWLNFLSQYKPEFKWIPGNTNVTADGISRRHDLAPSDSPASCVDLRQLLKSIIDGDDNLSDIEDTLTTTDIEDQRLMFVDFDHARVIYHVLQPQDIRAMCIKYYPTDRFFGPILTSCLKEGRVIQSNKKFIITDELLWYVDGEVTRLCIPDRYELQRILLFSEHDDPSRGHPGEYKTREFIVRKYYWPNLQRMVHKYVSSCEKCQRNKFRQTKPPGRLNPLPIPEVRWSKITMDFMVDLPMSQGFNTIWVIVDRLTKRAHFIAMTIGNGESSAKNCAKIFCKEYQRLHGVPESIISDRDSRFNNEFWQEFIKLQGTTHNMSSAFKPSTDGQSERTNRFIQDYLRNYIHPTQNNWSELLFAAEFAYNARVHDSIKMSPFEADLGYIPRSVPDHYFNKIIGTKTVQEAFDFGKKQQEILEKLKHSLGQAQERMKLYYDKNRPIQDFDIGDKVLISSKNLNIEHLGVVAGSTRKFAPLWIGPYPIIAKTTIDTYKLLLPIGLRVHPEIHTSLLKRYVKDNDNMRSNKPNEGMVVAGGFTDGYLIESIVDHKCIQGKIYYKIKWVGYSEDENTWEPLELIRKPASNLIDEYLSGKRLQRNEWLPPPKRQRKRR